MNPRTLLIAGASAGLVLTLSGCGSQKAAEVASSAQAVVSSAAAQASSALSSVAAEASAAASSIASQAQSAASAAASAIKPGTGTYTLADVAAHNSASDCWVAINGNVYDLTKWEDKHPGGKDKIVSLCGTDGSAAFTGQHDSQPKPNAALLPFLIGTLS